MGIEANEHDRKKKEAKNIVLTSFSELSLILCSLLQFIFFKVF